MRGHWVRYVAKEEAVAVLAIPLTQRYHFVLCVIKEEQTSQTKFAEFVVVKNLNFPNKRYRIILADPPWKYGFYTNKGKNVADPKYKISPYDGMEIEQIKKLPVNEIADDDCVLLLWITYPCLPWLTEVLEAWGFRFITVAFTWVKKNKNREGYFTGLGNYTRANAEICVLAKKGKGCKVLDRSISQIVDSPVREHSKKPNSVRDKIVKLFGDLPRIELFARTKVHGWDTWGDDHKLSLQPLENFS